MASWLLSASGTRGTAGRHDDGVERRLIGESLGAVGTDDLGIVVAEPLQPRASLSGKLLVALDCRDLAGDAAHHRRRVARARADLEHLVAGAKLGELDHARHDIRLRDGLARLDRQRRILVSEFLQRRGDEVLARHLSHGGKHERIDDAARLEMPRHHEGAVARVAVGMPG